MNTAFDKFLGKLAESYAGSNAALPPGFFDFLASIAWDLFEQCMNGFGTPESIIEDARTRSRRAVVLTTSAVRQAFRQAYGLFGYARYDGDKAVQHILQAGGAMEPADLKAVLPLINL